MEKSTLLLALVFTTQFYAQQQQDSIVYQGINPSS